MERRSDKYLCEDLIEKNKGGKFPNNTYLDGFRKGVYDACFVKNEEIARLQKIIEKLSENGNAAKLFNTK